MKAEATATSEKLLEAQVQGLSMAEYLRQRLQPSLRDVNYLHLSDLTALLRSTGEHVLGEVFDYGCGGAPYRQFFPHCKRYVGADVAPGPAVSCLLKADGTTGEPDDSYDIVLSSQVLEHVQQPGAYLAECRRLLRPGGQLLLTTHGMFEEHGCPQDFQRWTSRGLEELVSGSGLCVVESSKLTTELRAFVQLTNQMVLHLRCRERPLLHYGLAAVRKAYAVLGVPCLNWFADRFSNQAIVPGSSAASLYVCVFVRAVKT